MDEETRDLHNGKAKKRLPNVMLFGQLLWQFVCFVFNNRRLKTRAFVLLRCVFSYLVETHLDVFKDLLMQECSDYMRKNVFQPWKFQRALDLKIGLNLSGIDCLRSDVGGIPDKKAGVIPSGKTVARQGWELESFAAKEYGLVVEETITEQGISLKLDFEETIRLLVEAYGLGEYAADPNAEPVLIAVTLDYAQMSFTVGHLTGGIKLVDPRATNPISGENLFAKQGYQSREFVVPLQISQVKENAAVYNQDFKGFLDYFFGGPLKIQRRGKKRALFNFKVISPQDMSAHWKTMHVGGGCHSCNEFCHICLCFKSELPYCKVGNERCQRCKRTSCDNCYCHPVTDDKRIAECRALLKTYAEQAIDEDCSRLEAIRKSSRMKCNPNDAGKETDRRHIDFKPDTDDDHRAFNKTLKGELKLRLKGNMPELKKAVDESMEERRERLRHLLLEEREHVRCWATVAREERVSALTNRVGVEQAVPCVLHLEMRVSEKLFWSLLAQGLDRYQDGESKVREQYITAVTDCMRKQVLGDEHNNRTAQWTFPLKDSGKQVDGRTIPGRLCDKYVSGISRLATLVFSEKFDEASLNKEVTRAKNSALELKWQRLIAVYEPMMSQIKKKQDYRSVTAFRESGSNPLIYSVREIIGKRGGHFKRALLCNAAMCFPS